jgi:predicted Zn-dependent protease
VAFAEVASFVDYYVAQQGDRALPELLAELRDALPGATPSAAIEKVSGRSLAAWEADWRKQLAAAAPQLPAAVKAGPSKEALIASRKQRLGELLLGVARPRAAAMELSQALKAAPSYTAVRCNQADALIGQGRLLEAARLLADRKDMLRASGRWWSLHAALAATPLADASLHALSHDPLHPGVACQELPFGEYPAEPAARAQCIAAWEVPREPGQHYRFGLP